MRLLTFLVLMCSGLPPLWAQDVPEVTFGRVSDADRTLSAVPTDSTADAYVLYERQSLGFEYIDGEGPNLKEVFHTRIKLFRASAFHRADVAVTFYRTHGSVTDVEGFVHLPGGGSIPLPEASIIRETVRGDLDRVKFTFPRITEGAIIEYRYVRRKKSIFMPSTFYFQQDIPVRWAQFDALIPPYYGYVSLSSPNLDLNENKLTEHAFGPALFTTTYGTSNDRLEHADIRWAMKDLPAFREQPYSNNAVDYLPQVRLQLENVQYPNRPKEELFADWKTTVDELQARKDFGRYYRNRSNYGKVYKEFAMRLPAESAAAETVREAYDFVTRRIAWNGTYSMLADRSPNQVFADGSGNSADLNMVLLSLLNEAGVAAFPMLVSLRDRGAPIEQYPLLEQFDHLMVYCEVDGEPMLLDANEPSRPAGLVREDALNHRGWVGDPDNPRWVDLPVPLSRKVTTAEMEVTPSGTAVVRMRAQMNNYFALAARTRESVASHPDAQISEFTELTDRGDRSDRFDCTYRLELESGHVAGDYMYLQAVLASVLDAQLDDAEQRFLPIDFPYPWQQRYVARITLPENYALEEIPPPVRLKTEDGSIAVEYIVKESAENFLLLTFTVSMQRTLYAAKEYPLLREMFRRIIDLQETPLVLKKQAK